MSTVVDNPETDLRALLGQVRGELRALSQRLEALEARQAAAPAAAAERPAEPARGRAEVTEEDMLAIGAAVAAFLGVRAQIRQVRLVQSVAWAQMGRATIHASHRI